MSDQGILPFVFPHACRKKVTAAYDGGRIRADGGVMMLAQAAKRLGIADKLAAAIDDPHD